MKRGKVNYNRKSANGSEADRNQSAMRESLNGKTGKSKRVGVRLFQLQDFEVIPTIGLLPAGHGSPS
jgi:hypothetical protein